MHSQLKRCIDVRIMRLVETRILISFCATVGQNYVTRKRERASEFARKSLIIIALPRCPVHFSYLT